MNLFEDETIGLRKNDNKRISNIDDIFDKNDNFILPSLLLKK